MSKISELINSKENISQENNSMGFSVEITENTQEKIQEINVDEEIDNKKDETPQEKVDKNVDEEIDNKNNEIPQENVDKNVEEV